MIKGGLIFPREVIHCIITKLYVLEQSTVPVASEIDSASLKMTNYPEIKD